MNKKGKDKSIKQLIDRCIMFIACSLVAIMTFSVFTNTMAIGITVLTPLTFILVVLFFLRTFI